MSNAYILPFRPGGQYFSFYPYYLPQYYSNYYPKTYQRYYEPASWVGIKKGTIALDDGVPASPCTFKLQSWVWMWVWVAVVIVALWVWQR